MAAINLPLAEPYQPSSFVERGVDAPFTAPLLAGARVRPMQRPGIELVVPNPAGGRGVYVLPWSAARSMCRPTLHDLRLYQELRRLPALSPSSVRQAARTVAREGLAGQAAQEAAAGAIAAEAEARLRATSRLWIALRSASLPGLTPEKVAHDLNALGVLFVPIGLPPEIAAARLPRLIDALVRLSREADQWARINAGEQLATVAWMVASAAGSVSDIANRLLDDARSFAADTPGLLRQWMGAPGTVVDRLSRAEWVLDGWDRIVLLWREARFPAGQRAALLEIAQLLPDLPVEVEDWLGKRLPQPVPLRDCRVLSMNEGWRTGSASFGLVARNEQLRAASP